MEDIYMQFPINIVFLLLIANPILKTSLSIFSFNLTLPRSFGKQGTVDAHRAWARRRWKLAPKEASVL